MTSVRPDTIAAIATPPGRGGIAIVRLSGPDSFAIIRNLFDGPDPSAHPRTLLYGHIFDDAGPVDEVLVTAMPAPRSYTGEDVAEVHCHGGGAAASAILGLCLAGVARAACPGEFTRRALENGRIDLTRAEAVVAVVDACSRAELRQAERLMDGSFARRATALLDRITLCRALLEASLDFPHDETETPDAAVITAELQSAHADVETFLAAHRTSRRLMNGITIVIAGPVNSGKSSLFNALLGRPRAIVTDIPGTTRDWIEERVELAGLPVNLVDTAGLRETNDTVEAAGIAASHDLLARADAILLLSDGTIEAPIPSTAGHDDAVILRVRTKRDMYQTPPPACECWVSALTGEGLPDLRERIAASARTFLDTVNADAPLILDRHRDALLVARDALGGAIQSLENGGYDIAALESASAGRAIEAILGISVSPDVLDEVFRRFCVGK
jgi:tRNA modification GTPase